MLSFWLIWLATVLPIACAFVRPSPSRTATCTGQDPGTSLLSSAFCGAVPKERANIVYDDLTILLPAYNEADRIIETLNEYSSYISKGNIERDGLGSLLSIDILVVDDGSADDTAGVVRRYTECNPNLGLAIHCISLPSNEGKRGAVAFGIEEIVGRQQRPPDDSNSNRSGDRISLVLVADADGSGDLSCLSEMLHALDNLLVDQKTQKVCRDDYAALIVGNRGYDGAGVARIVLRWGFRTAVRIICGKLGASDTQCGMKLMTLDAAKTLYRDLNLRRWSHDVEVLYRATSLGVPVNEVPIKWEDKDGSKLVTSAGGAIGASLRMLLEILQMRVAYGLGRWKVPVK